ncbi:MAG TPA: tRNA (adenosine(37)-N6)-threonylcarbamoyltransferase complex dimerization subunit type 1 TsaB [Chloroflexota bacterium]|nr:tRNA (adenosine(37)-N6)-threonylcarbamoyltransferase complex dimerization subunit type 1 TsaB [Chloroflexota bacterium]
MIAIHGAPDPWSPIETEPPIILAFDTSSTIGGVALCRGFEVLGEETWRVGGSHTAQVLPAAARLCQRAGIPPRATSIAVTATGPGSFTGLRVGASLGKGLAAALGAALVGVPTLDALAHQHRALTGTLVALVDAGRGQVYAGTYRAAARGLTRRGEFVVLSEEELIEHVAALSGAAWIVGEMWPERAQVLAALPKVRVATPAGTLRRPAHLAELGYARFLRDGPSDAAALQPLYLKRGDSRR